VNAKWKPQMKEHAYYVYILTRKRNSVFYVGVTNDLIRRVYEHKNELIAGFTKKYNVKLLVYYEQYADINDAIHREKLIKKWARKIKIDAIERVNPDWRDLYFDLIDSPDPATSAG
jgi:putative endonuclease